MVAMLIVVGCNSGPSDPNKDKGGENPTTTASKETFTIGMSQCNLGEPYRAQMNKDIEAAAAQHPELKLVEKDAENDALKQRSHIEEFVQDKVDLIIISPK